MTSLVVIAPGAGDAVASSAVLAEIAAEELAASIEEVPVEGPVELSAVVRLDAFGLELQLGQDVVDELDGGLLVVAGVDPQHPQAGALTDGGVLVVPAASGGDRFDELDVDLHTVAGELLLVAHVVGELAQSLGLTL